MEKLMEEKKITLWQENKKSVELMKQNYPHDFEKKLKDRPEVLYYRGNIDNFE